MKRQNNYWEKQNIWNLSAFLKAKFLQICPYGKKYLDQIVKKCIRDMIGLSSLAVAIVLLWNSLFVPFSLIYLLESIFLAIYLVGTEIPNYRLQEKENQIYQELLVYFSRIKHCYISRRHISNAVLDAAEGMSYEVNRLAGEISRLLMESDRKDKIREYIVQHKSNRYLKLFLIQAYEVSEKGDAFFSENVEHIRLELMEEVYRRRRRTYEYTGYVFVAVTPFFLMPVLKQWGVEFTPELKFFYAGTGLLLETVIFIITLVIYGMIARAKGITLFATETGEKAINTDGFYKSAVISNIIRGLEKSKGTWSKKVRGVLLQSGENISYGKLCFNMLVISVATFLLLTAFYAETHRQERKTILEKVDSIDVIAPVASDEKKQFLAEYILIITNACTQRTDVTGEEIQEMLREKIKLGNDSLEMAVVQEIKDKLQQYENAKGNLIEIFVCFLGAIGAGLLPLLNLFFQAQMVYSEADYEVRQFQSILLLERRMRGVTIIGLLEDMEVFSRCFKLVLRKCINSYGSNPQGALLRLKQEGSRLHVGFEELADAFLAVDEVGIELAFEEVENNRRLLEKMSRLEAEIAMERKKDSTDFLARIPMILAVGIYFVLPFFMYSLQSVYEVFELLEEIQR